MLWYNIDISGVIYTADRLISLQFMVNNPRYILKDIPCRGLETEEQEGKRLGFTGSGTQIVQNVEQVSISQFVSVLFNKGYVLVDAFQQERKHKTGNRTYNIVRFTFSLKEYATPTPEFLKIQDKMANGLKQMAENSFWKVRAFRNPFFADNKEVPEEHAVSIDLANRVPRYENGQLIMVWPRDAHGNQDRTKSRVPLAPEGELRFNGGQMIVVEVPASV